MSHMVWTFKICELSGDTKGESILSRNSCLYKSIFQENFRYKNQKFVSYSHVFVLLCVFQDRMLNKIRNTGKDPCLKKYIFVSKFLLETNRCWRRNVLVTSFKCWWPILCIENVINIIFDSIEGDQKICHQHNFVINNTVTRHCVNNRVDQLTVYFLKFICFPRIHCFLCFLK